MSNLIVTHNYGFFSCCSMRLHKIIYYFNKNKACPDSVDSSQQFGWYKPQGETRDLTHDYFNKNLEDNLIVPFDKYID